MSSPSLWYSHTFCPCFHWGHPPSLESSLFPLKLSSIISPTNFPSPFPSHFHWRQLSCTEILASLRGSFPRWDTWTFLSLQGSRLSDWYFSCCCCKAWTLSPGDGRLIFKLYEVKWFGNMWTGLIFRSNFYLFKFPVVCYINWKKPKL